jgi:predicted metal-binding membrane protein
MGLRHGLFCVGCCWALMALLFAAGVMNLLWVAAIAAFVLVEKLVARGPLVGRLGGALLIAWGAFLLARSLS